MPPGNSSSHKSSRERFLTSPRSSAYRPTRKRPQNPPRNSRPILGAIVRFDPPCLDWLSNEAIWVPQWPLSREKLSALTHLVDEQLLLHLCPSHSPWNDPVFTIKKTSAGWRLLQDLRVINKTMRVWGSQQRGLLHISAISANDSLLAIDIQDCFFSVTLHT